ncbi:MAG TPA: hypothetical protein PK306_02580 [Aquabacterium sp.]|nr:hypothetical protein [Aquabacterium sp.]
MRSASDPVERLAELFLAVAWGKAVPPTDPTRFWFAKGVMKAVRTGGSLDEALGLTGAGRRELRTRLQQVRRDELIAEAVAAVALDDALSEWARCLRLAEEVARLQRAWPRVQALADPPSDWPACRRLLFAAAKVGKDLPQTAHGLRRALARNRAYSRNAAATKMLADYL